MIPPLPLQSAPDRRDALRRVLVAWLFGAAWMYIVTGAAATRFAQGLAMPAFGFGLLAASPYLAALVQLPTSYCLERWGGRKRAFLWTATAHRLLWLVVAALPYAWPGSGAWVGLIGLLMLSSTLSHVASPAWIAWMADLIPTRMRGRYFSRRLQYGQAVGLVLTLGVGFLLDLTQERGPRVLQACISLLLALAAISGTIDILLFLRVPDPGARRHRRAEGLREMFSAPLRNPHFRCYLGYAATMTFAVGFVGQFVWLYVFDVAHMSNLRANLLLVSIPLLAAMVSYPFWGRMVDRFGPRTVMLVAGLFVINGATAWMFVRPESWRWGYLLVLFATVAWPAMELASFNLLLRISQSRGGLADTAPVAINSAVTAVAGALSGLFGGAVAEWLKDWQGTLLGWPLTYHGVLFIISAVLRAAALAWVFGLHEERQVSTRTAIRYMAVHLYSNVQQVVLLPLRQFGWLGELTYKLTRPRR
jgi:MFS family permease